MPQLENRVAIGKRTWKAQDTLRANSNYASNEYFLPVMGQIFLRHTYSRFLLVKIDRVRPAQTRWGHARTEEEKFLSAEFDLSPAYCAIR